MNNFSLWQSAITSSSGQVWASVLATLPALLGAIVVFAVGLLIAFWVKRLVVELLRVFQVEKLSQVAGINKYLKKADIKHDLVDLLGVVAEWLVILAFFLAVVDILGLSVVSQVLARILGFVPNILAAAFIIAAGYVIAGVVDGLVRGALVSIDHEMAKPVGKFSRWLVLIIAFFAAVDQLQIAQGLIQTFFQGLTYTIVLIVGLSVGLGAKGLVAKVLDDWYNKVKK